MLICVAPRWRFGWNVCSCITKSRGGQFAFWSLQHNGLLSLAEMCKLQGLLKEDLKIIISPTQMGNLLGNELMATVLARVLGAAIQAAERCQSVGQNPVAHPSGQPLCQPQAATTGGSCHGSSEDTTSELEADGQHHDAGCHN